MFDWWANPVVHRLLLKSYTSYLIKIILPSGRLSDPGPDFGLARTVTPLDGGLPRPRLTPVSRTGDGGESAAAVDSMTADATAEAALTGLVLLILSLTVFSFFLLFGVSEGDGADVVADDDDDVVLTLLFDAGVEMVRLGADVLPRLEPGWKWKRY